MKRTDKPVTPEAIEDIMKIVMDGNELDIDYIMNQKYNHSRAEYIGYLVQKYFWENKYIATEKEMAQQHLKEYVPGQVSMFQKDEEEREV